MTEEKENREESQADTDIDEAHYDDPLSAPDFHSLAEEIIGDLTDYVQTQGPMTDEEVRSYIENYLYDEKQRYGELQIDMESDETYEGLIDRIIEEWNQRKDELMIDPPELD